MTLEESRKRAAHFYRLGRLGDAEIICREILAAAPADFQANYLQAVIRYRDKKPDAALPFAERAIQADPRNPDALTLYGVLLQGLKRHDAALISFTDAAALTPDRAEAHYNRGVVLGLLGRMTQALAAFDSALTIDPGLFEGWKNRGAILQTLDRSDEALESFDRALALRPHHADALYSRAIILESLDRPVEAVQAYNKCLEIAPRNPEAWNNRGVVLHKLSDFVEALRCFDKSLSIRAFYPSASVNRAISLRVLRRFDEALICLDGVLAQDPANEAALETRGAVLCESDRVAEGLATYMHRIALGRGGNSDAAIPAHRQKHDLEQRDYLLAQGVDVRDGPFHLAEGDRLATRAVNKAAPDIARRWQSATPQMIVIDDLLTQEALTKLRRFCWGSTIWRRAYADGYLGATLSSGFACPLLAQISEELRDNFPAIFGGLSLVQLWAFKYDSQLRGIRVHADQAAVNVNFWITPDEANLDPESGGLVIWDKSAPLDWDFARYNNDEAAVRAFLARAGSQAISVPYRANRAVIFDSDLFHQTDHIRFREGYLNRRINVTLLYGRRGRAGD